MYVSTIAPDAAEGPIAQYYAEDTSRLGFVTAATACWTARPDLLPLFEDFCGKVKAGFSLTPRDWRLITFIAAKHVPSTYCSHMYGQMLRQDLGSREAVLAVLEDYRSAGLSDREIAMLAFTEKVVKNASEVRREDIDLLRALGFTDTQVSDIALCASLRCFISRFFDAMGVEPERHFLDADDTFRTALTVGKTLRLTPSNDTAAGRATRSSPAAARG